MSHDVRVLHHGSLEDSLHSILKGTTSVQGEILRLRNETLLLDKRPLPWSAHGAEWGDVDDLDRGQHFGMV